MIRQIPQLTFRPAVPADLEAVNAVIEAALMQWDLPERVKRLSLPSYRYQAHDLDHLELTLVESAHSGIVGIAAWEQADRRDTPAGRDGLLLHGLYVAPEQQRRGIGRQLLQAAEAAARSRGLEAVLVKAQPGAEAFFRACGLRRLPVRNPDRDYPHRFWKHLAGSARAGGSLGHQAHASRSAAPPRQLSDGQK